MALWSRKKSKKKEEPVVAIEESQEKIVKAVAKKAEATGPFSMTQNKGDWEVRKNGRLIYSNPSKANAERFIKARP